MGKLSSCHGYYFNVVSSCYPVLKETGNKENIFKTVDFEYI